MSKKKLDPNDITEMVDELNQSGFFRRPVPEEPALNTSESQKPDVHASIQTGKPVNPQTSLHANRQARKHASTQTSKPVSMQARKQVSMQPGKHVEKYSTYLTRECKQGLRRIAFETDRKDYEILVEAVEEYLLRHPIEK